MVSHRDRRTTKSVTRTPLRPSGYGGIGPSAMLPLLDRWWHRLDRCATSTSSWRLAYGPMALVTRSPQGPATGCQGLTGRRQRRFRPKSAPNSLIGARAPHIIQAGWAGRPVPGRFPSIANSDNRLGVFSVKNNGIEKAGQQERSHDTFGSGIHSFDRAFDRASAGPAERSTRDRSVGIGRSVRQSDLHGRRHQRRTQRPLRMVTGSAGAGQHHSPSHRPRSG